MTNFLIVKTTIKHETIFKSDNLKTVKDKFIEIRDNHEIEKGRIIFSIVTEGENKVLTKSVFKVECE